MHKPTIIYKFSGHHIDMYPAANSVIPQIGAYIQTQNKEWIVKSVKHYIEPHENCIIIICQPLNI